MQLPTLWAEVFIHEHLLRGPYSMTTLVCYLGAYLRSSYIGIAKFARAIYSMFHYASPEGNRRFHVWCHNMRCIDLEHFHRFHFLVLTLALTVLLLTLSTTQTHGHFIILIGHRAVGGGLGERFILILHGFLWSYSERACLHSQSSAVSWQCGQRKTRLFISFAPGP
jgi:hypothetical protein